LIEKGKNLPDDNHCINNAADCANWVKELLINCGISYNYSDTERTMLVSDIAAIDGLSPSEEISDSQIVCYVLRRNFATIARNEMGLSSYETDRLLGHRPQDANGKKASKFRNIDMNSTDTQKNHCN
jgi:hypothetical protein